ncbi:MAG TPA: nucleotide sugar dehydrogenase [Candidatus Baltobacteraceae bacterium]|jgi:UDP-N-acetyl-D-glucosamine dehydrogenase
MNLLSQATHAQQVQSTPPQRLRHLIKTHEALVGVVGIGYVGLPLAVEQAKARFQVLAFDRSAIRVAQANQGLNYIRDVNDEDLARVVASGKFTATTDMSRLGSCDVIVICVPTPLTPNKEPDISYITNVVHDIASQLRPGQLIILESTTYPGTTEEVVLPILQRSELIVGKDFYLGFSPERVDPGNKRFNTHNTNKVVGAVTAECLDMAATFYEQTITEVLRVSSPRVAEMTKVFENTFRAVNIALVNEMALLCDRMGIDIWSVIDAAATKPFGIMRFEPGPGVGGHCIPLDPHYLSWKARQYDYYVRFIELAAQVNQTMPYFVRDRIARSLNKERKSLRGSQVLVLGMAYKRDVSDWRESPSLKVVELLENDGANVKYHDPHIASFADDHGKVRRSVPLTDDLLASSDCVAILTDHSAFDWERIVARARLVVDTRNATCRVESNREKIVLL